MSSRSDWIPYRQRREMRAACLLILFAAFCVRSSLQRVDDRTIDSQKMLNISVNNDTPDLERNEKDWNMKKLQQLLKQVTNSTSNTTNLTADKQGPCQCGGGVCGCCSRILYDTWKQKACVNVTYDPDEFSFTAKVSMNDRVLYTRTVSGTFVTYEI